MALAVQAVAGIIVAASATALVLTAVGAGVSSERTRIVTLVVAAIADTVALAAAALLVVA